MSHLRIIGDVHAQIDETVREGLPPYLQLIEACDYSVQVGDMGDAIAFDLLRQHVDASRHRFVPGNHDDYDDLPPHSLGDFGTIGFGGIDFFFVRGAHSSDKKLRLEQQRRFSHKLWWPEEELTSAQMEEAEAQYRQARPRIVISHDCPTVIGGFITSEVQQRRGVAYAASRTSELLERMWQSHAPAYWYFGHHHFDWQYEQDGTVFRCLGELSFVDVDQHGVPVDR